MQKIKYGVDNIFDYLPNNITTINVILDSCNHSLDEFDKNIETIVSQLDKKHSYNDDFFDTNVKQVLTLEQVCNKYNLQIT